MDGYKQAAELLRALGHPFRLQIIEVLASEREACVCHLECRLGLRQAYISQQLSRLREAGLVVTRREGLNVFYSLADDSLLPLLQASRASAIKFSRRRGKTLGFRMRGIARGTSCNCPKCLSLDGAPAA
jgi:DNA-binding transcriptional ArsR family regulator